jgi:hypothetical protein
VGLSPVPGRREDFPGIGKKDDTFTGAEGPYVELLPALLRYGPQVVVPVELGVEVNLHLGAPQGGEVLPDVGLADLAHAAGAAR